VALGQETRTVLLEFVGDASNLQGASKKASGSLDGVASSGKKTSGALAALKPAAIAAGAAAAGMAAQWAIAGIGMAEAAESASIAFDKTFGDAGADFLAQNEEMRLAMGLTEAEFMKQATALGAVGIGMGQTSQQAAAMSDEILTIAADVAAFNGEIANAPEVVDAMSSAFAGSFETLDKYGISVTAAMVEQQALADTGKAAASELTELEKREATLAIVAEQTALQQGSLNEAMERGATTSNEASAKMGEAQTAVGDALLPVKRLAAEGFLVLADLLLALSPILETFADLISNLAKVISPLLKVLGVLAEFLAKVLVATNKLFSPINHAIYLFERLSSKIKSAFSWTPPSWMQSMGIRGFHSGGRVPGPAGSSQMIMAQGGEQIVPGGSAGAPGNGGGGGGTVINVTINTGVGDPMEIGRQLSDVLTEYGRQVGGIPLKVVDGE
jgi:hypothetical protein